MICFYVSFRCLGCHEHAVSVCCSAAKHGLHSYLGMILSNMCIKTATMQVASELFCAAVVPHEVICAPLVRLLAAAPAVSAVTSTALMVHMRAHGTMPKKSLCSLRSRHAIFLSARVRPAMQQPALPALLRERRGQGRTEHVGM